MDISNLNLTSIAGLTAIGAIVATTWRHIATFGRYLVGIVIGTTVVKDDAGCAVISFAFTRGIRSPLGMRVFGGFESYIHPKRWRETVAYESISGDPVIIKYGRQFAIISLAGNASVDKVGEFDIRSRVITIKYFRWFFDIEKFTSEAIEHYNNQKRQGLDNTKSKNKSLNRFRIVRFSGGSGRGYSDESPKAQGNNPASTVEVGSIRNVEHLIATGVYRLLKWKQEDLQMKPEEGQSAFTGYPFPKEIESAITELDLWMTHEKWFRSKSIPWRRGWLLHGPPGTGKCLGKGTPIMMFDGRILPVEEIKEGDLLMGPDSRPRKVLSTTSGIDELYRVTPIKGDSYVVNGSHILSLKMSGNNCGYKHGDIINISIGDYKQKSKWFKNRSKGWRTGIDFPTKKVPLDPYFLGLWLGDGSSNSPRITSADKEIQYYCEVIAEMNGLVTTGFYQKGKATTVSITTGDWGGKGFPRDTRNPLIHSLRYLNVWKNKHIPHLYKTSGHQQRMELLAGLLDTDGSLCWSGGFDFISKWNGLAEDVAYIARSLGFAAYVKPSRKRCNNGKNKDYKTYWRVSISGDVSKIPTKLLHKQASKRKQVKNVLVTGVDVTHIGMGEYHGFQLDKDGLFLLGDFTVTHNSTLVRALGMSFDLPVYIFDLSGMSNDALCKSWEEMMNCTPCIALIEDIDNIYHGREYVGNQTPGIPHVTFDCLLNNISGVKQADGVFLIITTNHVNKLDPAIGIPDANGRSTRPGRIDKALELGLMANDQRVALAKHILSDFPDLVDKTVVDGEGETAAQFQARCAGIALDKFWKDGKKVAVDEPMYVEAVRISVPEKTYGYVEAGHKEKMSTLYGKLGK